MKDLSKREEKQLRHLLQEKKERLLLETEIEDGAATAGLAEDATLRVPIVRQIARNVEQLVIVSAADEKPPDQMAIDRYLILAELEELEPVICLNKIDRADRAQIEKLIRLYRRIGYVALGTSATSGEGVPALREKLEYNRSVIAGPAGSGKSSLIRCLDLGIEKKLETSEVELVDSKGKQSKTTVNLYHLVKGMELVEAPALNLLNYLDLQRDDVRYYFKEFTDYSRDCIESDCRHLDEDDCAVRQAVADGEISRERYKSYCTMVRSFNSDGRP